MKNIIKTTACLLSALLLATSAMAADYWTDDVVVNAGYGAATIDGVYNADEWATAEEIEISMDDATVKTYGVYQGSWEGARDAKDFNAKMYFMWDEEALYICEVRMDDVVDLGGTGATPWGGSDGNLIFFQAADGGSSENPEAWSHHIFYIAGDGTNSGKYGGDPWVRLNDGTANTQETVQYSSIKAVAAPIDGGFCVEVKVPWSVINEKIPDFIPEADVEVGMSMVPIDFDNGDFAQLCWVNQADALGVQGGYDYGGWATMVLNAAPVVETEAEVVDVVVDAPAAAPQTFDAGVIAAVAAIVSAAGYALSKKR
ncbi:MAG: hypothetical protein IJB15_11945 [Clostridia bacterium]|nr:hypothetical protein [Clostridia bacterium]MBQ4607411.1 hypothetical protein [Clostridia bacterium]